MGQLDDATPAHADDASAIVANIEGVEAVGQTDLSDGLTDVSALASAGDGRLTSGLDAFTAGDTSTGLSDLLIAGDFFAFVDPQELARALASSF